ncbi:MAG: MerR family transcriptional regulator [Lachnospiraceae bacterium]
MGEVRYMISEAAKRVTVETHVLRYWEEELNLPIGRTEMGHRYYTQEDIQLFCCIRELKEQGILLKELKNIIPEMQKTRQQLHEKKELQISPSPEIVSNDKLEQVRFLIGAVLKEIITENNQSLGNEISLSVSENVKKEMDNLLQSKEHLEEERYKKLDKLIRQQQLMRKEVSKSSPTRRLKQFLGTMEA